MLKRRGLAQDEGGALACPARWRKALSRPSLTSPFLSDAAEVIGPEFLSRSGRKGGGAVRRRCGGHADGLCRGGGGARGRAFPGAVTEVLVCGGGRHNAGNDGGAVRAACRSRSAVEAAGLNGDMLEAQAFAYLAVRVLRGLPTSAPMTPAFRPRWGAGRSAVVGAGRYCAASLRGKGLQGCAGPSRKARTRAGLSSTGRAATTRCISG